MSFFITSMPDSRTADYYLGYMDGSIFLDFDESENGKICLRRLSFDGYGCCELGNLAVPLNPDDSMAFKRIISDNVKDQNTLTMIIKKAIALNKSLIWADALEEYHLI